MKYWILIAMLALSGCGKMDQMTAHYTGSATICMHGVAYYQFTSGAAPAYLPDGKLITC